MSANSKYNQFLNKMNSYQESIDDLKVILNKAKKDYKKLETVSNLIIDEFNSGTI